MKYLDKIYFANSVADWLIFLAYIVAAIILAKFIYWLSKKVIRKLLSKNKFSFDDIFLDMFEEPFVLLIILLGFSLAFSSLNLSEKKELFLDKAFKVGYMVNVVWFVARLFASAVKYYGKKLVEKDTNKLDDHLLHLFIKVFRIVIWVLGLVITFNSIGFDLTALIGGLGIGGIALAMAAKDSISNIFGGITIFLDKPFKMGDRIKIKGYDGFVTDIGLRISRIRSLEGRIITIPNALFLGDMIENVTLEPTRKVVLDIGLVYATTAEQMDKAITLLKEIVAENQGTDNNTLAFFNAFNASSLNIKLIYYIVNPTDILDVQTQINLEILKKFNENGFEMAFPTQTLHVTKD